MCYYVGLMSGTSADGIDAALVNFENNRIDVLRSIAIDHEQSLHDEIQKTSSTDFVSLKQLGELDIRLGHVFSDAVLALIDGFDKNKIVAIGSHGQTVHHHPDGQYPFTLQLGNASIIAERTGINTVSDFRSNDIAAGGQGAPLAPLFHRQCFSSSDENRAIINIGGIANLTYLPKDDSAFFIGFDTGPGNTLMDKLAKTHLSVAYDKNGDWARGGNLNENVLMTCLADAYFKKSPPKSTGKEYFNMDWVSHIVDIETVDPQNMQTTLSYLTAHSISDSVKEYIPQTDSIYLCGGGVKNSFLVELIQNLLPDISVKSSAELGLDPDFVEATAFAWLAKCRIEDIKLDTGPVTGANHRVALGAVYHS